MAANVFKDLLCIFSFFILFKSAIRGSEISHLRRFKVGGVAGTFLVPRKIVSEELTRRKEQGAQRGNEVDLRVPELTLNVSSDTSEQAQLFVALTTIEDITLKEELSSEMKEEVAIKYSFLTVGIPFFSGERHGILFVNTITDSAKHVLDPYFTNYQAFTRVDGFDERNDGTVVIYKNNDVIELTIKHDSECKLGEGKQVLEDFDEITGKGIATNYPLPFDWGCDLLKSENVSFCRIIEENMCDLHKAELNVCVTESTTISQRCPATLKFLNVTGIFQDELLSFIPNAPVTSSEGEWLRREHSAGILFPCFTE